jgi:hypothetical protein
MEIIFCFKANIRACYLPPNCSQLAQFIINWNDWCNLREKFTVHIFSNKLFCIFKLSLIMTTPTGICYLEFELIWSYKIVSIKRWKQRGENKIPKLKRKATLKNVNSDILLSSIKYTWYTIYNNYIPLVW